MSKPKIIGQQGLSDPVLATTGSIKPSYPVLMEYGFAVILVGVSTAISFAMYSFFELTNLVMPYLLGTLVVSTRGRRGPAALSAALGVLCFDFFFVPPRFSFRVSDTQYLLTFFVMFAVAMMISQLAIRLRSEAKTAQDAEARTSMMHAFTQRLANTRGIEEILQTALSHLADNFKSLVTIYTPDKKGQLQAQSKFDENALSKKALGVAQWVFDQARPAGLGTDALPEEIALTLPLLGSTKPVGVLRITPRDRDGFPSQDQQQLITSFAHQIALALEVEQLREIAKISEVEVETERLRSSLLSSVSHDFRTPLTAIVGSASTLLEYEDVKKNSKAFALVENIQEEGERLSRLVQNLLETTRLESGRVQLRKEQYPIEEIIGSSLERIQKSHQSREILVELPEDLPMIPLDALLIEQVFINLLENGIRHTPAGAEIKISAKLEGQSVQMTIADRGKGIEEADRERVFDKFFHDKSSPGAGLGLAICRAIINAHGGRIWCENQPTGTGAVLRFILPLESTNENR